MSTIVDVQPCPSRDAACELLIPSALGKHHSESGHGRTHLLWVLSDSQTTGVPLGCAYVNNLIPDVV
jgi:hypothetical protein